MDEHNVHHFWGISPAIDLGALAAKPSVKLGKEDTLRILQVKTG